MAAVSKSSGNTTKAVAIVVGSLVLCAGVAYALWPTTPKKRAKQEADDDWVHVKHSDAEATPAPAAGSTLAPAAAAASVAAATPAAPPAETTENAKSKANDLKVRGNEAYQNKDYVASVLFYTEAIALYPDQDAVLSVFYCNRAAALLQLGENERVVADCTRALELQKFYYKAISRRSQAYESLGNLRAALADHKTLMQSTKADKTVRAAAEQAVQRLLLDLAHVELEAYLRALGEDVPLPAPDLVREFLALLLLPSEAAPLTELDASVAAAPADGSLRFRRALAYVQTQAFASVIPEIKAAVDLLRASLPDTKDTLVHALNVQGLFAYLNMNSTLCTDSFAEAMQLDDKNARTFARWALCLSDWRGATGGAESASALVDKSIAALHQALELQPTDPEVLAIHGKVIALFNVATNHALSQQHANLSVEQARVALEEATRTHPGFIVPMYACMAQSLTGDANAATATLAAAAARHPTEPLLACQMLELEMQSSTPTTESLQQMAIKITAMAATFPKYPQAILNQALMLLQTGKVTEGLARLEDSLRAAGRAPDFLLRAFQIRESVRLQMSS